MRRNDVHRRIMEAARKGKGLRLSADEVFILSTDEAIKRWAESADEEPIKTWRSVPPREDGERKE